MYVSKDVRIRGYFAKPERDPRVGWFGKHWSVALAYKRSIENSPRSLCFTFTYKNRVQNSNPRTRPLFLMPCPDGVSHELF
jgi:hypothetical protein